MSALQAIAGFIYQVQVVSTYAYLPEMAREVGQARMNSYTAIFTQTQFSSVSWRRFAISIDPSGLLIYQFLSNIQHPLQQATFTVVVIGVSFMLQLHTVHTAMVGQTAVVLWCVAFFIWGWKYLPSRPARHTLQEGQWMLTAGFAQNWSTAKAIWSQYRKGLKWYLLALVFAEASAAAITNISSWVFLWRSIANWTLDMLFSHLLFANQMEPSIHAVIYLSDVVGLNILQVGIFFLVALLGTIPGMISRWLFKIHFSLPNYVHFWYRS